MRQTTNAVLMVQPIRFGYNEQTAVTNNFQSRISALNPQQIQDIALLEFNNAVALLRKHGIEVIVFEDTPYPHTPDSIFPNNWLSTHANGTCITYGMKTPNRRQERREDIVSKLSELYGYGKRLAMENFEPMGKILEGTGSMVLDRQYNIIYSAISERTHSDLVNEFASKMGCDKVVLFTAYDADVMPIYHTNVVMGVGETFAVIGTDTIINRREQKEVIKSLEACGHEIIHLSNAQLLEHYAGNMLQLKNDKGETILVLSQQAHDSLDHHQLRQLENHNDILLPIPIHVIETIGGGSIRCMLCEIFKVNR